MGMGSGPYGPKEGERIPPALPYEPCLKNIAQMGGHSHTLNM